MQYYAPLGLNYLIHVIQRRKKKETAWRNAHIVFPESKTISHTNTLIEWTDYEVQYQYVCITRLLLRHIYKEPPQSSERSTHTLTYRSSFIDRPWTHKFWADSYNPFLNVSSYHVNTYFHLHRHFEISLYLNVVFLREIFVQLFVVDEIVEFL